MISMPNAVRNWILNGIGVSSGRSTPVNVRLNLNRR